MTLYLLERGDKFLLPNVAALFANNERFFAYIALVIILFDIRPRRLLTDIRIVRDMPFSMRRVLTFCFSIIIGQKITQRRFNFPIVAANLLRSYLI